MPKITTKQEFIKQLKQYTKTHQGSNIIDVFDDNKIIIEETEEDGKGEIYLDISSYLNDVFFIKITHQSVHNIGKKNHNDGIVLKIDLENEEIVVYLFELKKQLRFNKLEKATIQLVSAYRFIKYLMLEECFQVKYKFFIAYEINNIGMDVLDLKSETNKYALELYKSFVENKDTIPLQIPFCSFDKFDFKQVEFGNTIEI